AGQEGGTHGQDFFLARLNSDGSPDTGFGTAGQVTTDFAGFDDSAFGVALQSYGMIVEVGSVPAACGGTDSAVARYNANGSADAGFGSGGKVTTNLGSSSDVASSVIIQSDGKILAGGSGGINNGVSGHTLMSLARYNADGSLDSGFGSGGTAALA